MLLWKGFWAVGSLIVPGAVQQHSDSVTEAAWGWGSHWRTVLVSCDLMDVLVHGVSGTLIMKCLLDTFQSTSEVLRSRKDIHTPSFLSLTWSGLAFTCGQWKNKPFPRDLSRADLKLPLHKPLFFWTLKEHLKDKLSKLQCCKSPPLLSRNQFCKHRLTVLHLGVWKRVLGICVLILNSSCDCWSMDLHIGAAELNNPHSNLGSGQVTTVKFWLHDSGRTFKQWLGEGLSFRELQQDPVMPFLTHSLEWDSSETKGMHFEGKEFCLAHNKILLGI